MKQKEFFDLADEMERECGDWENSEGMSAEALSSLIAKVEALDAKEQKMKEPKKKPIYRFKKRYIFVVAAALVLLMGTGVVGDRAWISECNDLERHTEVTTKVNNEEKESVLREEEEIYQEIADTLGIVPMRLGYKPDGMDLDSYTIMENTGWANLYYLYNEDVIFVRMSKLSEEVSSNVQWDGSSRKLENIINEFDLEIEGYCIDEENHSYTANLAYGNGYYNISGLFDVEEDFLKILNGIYFKNM